MTSINQKLFFKLTFFFGTKYDENENKGKVFSEKYGYKIDANQEMIALGLSNLGAGFTSGYCVSASLSR